jgi:16S rRNA (cytosine1402-N4)-methyltransferase
LSHYSVMLPEVLDALQPASGEVYVDGTFGAGGYTSAILDKADCTVVAIDRDPDAKTRAQTLKAKYGERLIFVQGCFGDVETLLRSVGFEKVDGFVLDLGVSSMQINEADRGFSFRFDGPLDMRMDNTSGQSAADLVNSMPEKDLADMIYKYGEERHSRRIAKNIVLIRREKKFATTAELAEAVRSVVPKSRKDEIDPATRTFQALRIAVNDELGELERALDSAARILKYSGRLVVVSFHSLEDGMVKQYLRDASDAKPQGSRHMPEAKKSASLFKLISKKAKKPSEQEVRENSRSRSARLRAAIRTEAA